MIYEPVEPRKIGPITVHGLFLRRQREAAEVYAAIIAEDVLTLENLGDELLNGPRSDRTRQMIERALQPAIDEAVGPNAGLLKAAIGSRRYESIRSSVSSEAVEYAVTPLADADFNKRQSAKVRNLVASRMRDLDPGEFSLMLRSVTEQDEWLLLAHGAVLGFGAGLIHLAIFG